MALNFLIADTMHESIFNLLDEERFEYDYMPDITRKEIIDKLHNYDVLIIRSKTVVDEELISQAPNLKVVCRAGAGIDNLDVEILKKREIYIINAPEGNKDAVAEHCIGMLLNLLCKINIADGQVRNGIWDREGNRGFELKGKTVAIIGYGNMGSAFAKRLTSFECKILVFDKYKKNLTNDLILEVGLDEIFKEADIVSFHIPLTSETRYWVDEDLLDKFKKPIILINTSRGEIIKLKTIVKGIETGRIAGAALDVLENEKLSGLTKEQQDCFNYLKNTNRVIFTPHVAGWSNESYERINQVIIKKIKLWLNDSSV